MISREGLIFCGLYFYFYLVRLYGPVVVLPDRPFDTDEDVASVSFERSTYDECVEKICADFEEAAKLLPASRIDALQYIPTKGAALAFKARMQLYAASPLFNGNSYYSDWKDSEGRNFIAQTEDKVKWGKAAATFKRIIDMNKYAIHTVSKIVNEKGTGTLPLPETVSDADFPDGAGGIDPYKSYKTLFDGTYQPELVKEYIYFSKNNGNYILVTPSKLGGISSFSVTLDMIDEYRMVDRLVKLLRRKNHGRQWDKIKHSRQIIFFPETELIVMMVASRVFMRLLVSMLVSGLQLPTVTVCQQVPETMLPTITTEVVHLI